MNLEVAGSRPVRHPKTFARVAQLVEHLLGKQEAIGSNPIAGSTRKETPHAKSKKPGLTIVGETTDGKKVVQGLFPLMSSVLGTPLDLLLSILKQQDMVVDWVEFYESSKKHGWTDKTVLLRISTEVSEVYGPKYRDVVISKLKEYIELTPQ